MRDAICSVGIMAVVVILSSCAAKGVYLPENTQMLGEVSHVLTQAGINAGSLGPDTRVENLSAKIQQWGFTNDQIAQGRVIVVRQGIYWNNVVSGIKRDMLRAALLPEGMTVEIGNIIEGIQGSDAYTISRVRARDRKDGHCRYDELPTSVVKGLMGTVSLVGPSGAATLYCEGIENEGWQRPRTYWHKLPRAHAESAK
jgi:hypothetical protein